MLGEDSFVAKRPGGLLEALLWAPWPQVGFKSAALAPSSGHNQLPPCCAVWVILVPVMC